MALHIVAIGAESAVNQATAITALNVILAAEIVTADPAPVRVDGYSNAVAVGPIYAVSAIIDFN